MFRNPNRQTRMRTGFTLIELLVVIAIIALLAAILFPVFAKARERARITTGLSNARQLTLGIYQYEQDADEVLPIAGFLQGQPNTIATSNWPDAIYSYVKSEGVYKDPDDVTTNNPLDSDNTPGQTGKASATSYLMAQGLVWGSSATPGNHLQYNAHSDSEIASPSEMFLLMEGYHIVYGAGGAGSYYATKDHNGNAKPNGTIWQGEYIQGHGPGVAMNLFLSGEAFNQSAAPTGSKVFHEGLIVTFVDGHAKYLAIPNAAGGVGYLNAHYDFCHYDYVPQDDIGCTGNRPGHLWQDTTP